MKIVFGMVDVRAFKAAIEKDGLKFGIVHQVEGLEFANAKDPAGNSIQISNRACVIPPHPSNPGLPENTHHPSYAASS
jgi:hypothetical protein